MTRVVVVADTHIRRNSRRELSAAAYAALRDADTIVHAGDVLTAEFLEELATFAPVIAVLGNNDHELVGALPEERRIEIDGVRIAIVHDSGARAGRARRLRRRFPDADVVVFGHSHEPQCEPGEDGQLLVNPGSPTERRRAPAHTLAVLELGDGAVQQAKIVTV